MLTVSEIRAGSGYEYLMREIARADDYYVKGVRLGEAPGQWHGGGTALLGLSGEATEMQMRSLYGKGEDPLTGNQLGRKFAAFASFEDRIEDALKAEPNASALRRSEIIEGIRRADPAMCERVEAAWAKESDATEERKREIEIVVRRAAQRNAVAGFDLTFSPVKSVSVLWAGLDEERRALVVEAHGAAVRASLDEFERIGLHTRAGTNGIRQIDVKGGLIAAMFRHRTNRKGEPQLHTHAAVLNRVMGAPDAKWRTIDGKSMFTHIEAIGRHYDRVLEGELTKRLGVAWVDVESGSREVVGIPVGVRDLFSTRRAAVAKRQQALVDEYVAENGVAPSRSAMRSIMRRAVTEARPAKKASEDDVTAGARWVETARANGVDLPKVAAGACGRAVDQVVVWPEDLARQAIELVTEERSTVTRPNVLAAVRRLAPVDPSISPSELAARTDEVCEQAMAGMVSLTPTRSGAQHRALRRASGASVYERQGEARFASAHQLATEKRLVALAGENVGWSLERSIESLVGESGASPAQREVATELLIAQRRARVLVGPAGTGKTWTQRLLAEAYAAEGHEVVGLTVSQAAAQVLAQEAGIGTWNLTRWRHAVEAGTASLPEKGVLIVDEAGMVPTQVLAWVMDRAVEADCAVLLVGDHAQLAAPAAGGAFRMLAADGYSELEEVRRFRAAWEGPASLRLRAGEEEVLAEYQVRRRIIEGTEDDVRAQVLDGWLTDLRRGRRTIIVAASNEDAAELSRECRRHLVDDGAVDAAGVVLDDGNLAGVGDVVMSRRNVWKLRTEQGAPVLNRSTWKVTGLDSSGGLEVLAIDPHTGDVTDDRITLPAAYVSTDVELAYAGTVHSAQGRTVDTCHAAIGMGSGWTRETLYVAMTRGRWTNTAYVPSIVDMDSGQVLQRDPVEVLGGILGRTTANIAALEVAREEVERATGCAELGLVWHDVLDLIGRQRVTTVLGRVDRDLPGQFRRSSGQSALVRALREIELDGDDPYDMVRLAATERSLGDVDDLGALLHWRIEQRHPIDAPLGRDRFSFVSIAPEGRDSLAVFAREVAQKLDDRIDVLGVRAEVERPAWSARLVDAEPEVWRRNAGMVAAYREMFGIAEDDEMVIGKVPHRERTEARMMWMAAEEALGGVRLSQLEALERAAAEEVWTVGDEEPTPALAALVAARATFPGVRGMSDRALRDAVEVGERALKDAPKDRGYEIELATRHLRQCERGEAQVLSTLGRMEGERPKRGAELARWERDIAQLEARKVEKAALRADATVALAELERVQAERSKVLAETAPVRELGHDARRELGRRAALVETARVEVLEEVERVVVTRR